MTDKPVKKILLIDDEESGYDLMKMKIAAFVSGPWELDWANTYNAGLKKMCSGRYAVCLLDNQLREDRDGLSLLREARQRIAMDRDDPVPGDEQMHLVQPLGPPGLIP